MAFTSRISTLSRTLHSNARMMGSAAKFAELGNPRDVFKVEAETVGPCGADEVAVKMLFAPITPADIQAASGSYMPCNLPTVGGSHGVGVVTEVGSNVDTLNVGDHVVPGHMGLGTWTTELKADASALQRVSSELAPEFASALASPCAAYRMLNDFVNLNPGDVVIQNGANGSVGLSVIQMAKAMGVKTVNIMRNRPGFEDLSESLQNLGADVVVPQEYAATPAFEALISDMGPVKLGLNCVGGQHASAVMGGLSNGATMVTYGAMSGKSAISVASSAFFMKDLTLKGFNLQSWMASASAADREAMLAAVTAQATGGDAPLHLWLETRPFSEFSDALKRATSQFVDRKVVLDMSR